MDAINHFNPYSMTLKQFDHLSPDDKDYIVAMDAILVAVEEDPEGDYALYQLYGFYLEIFYTDFDDYRARTICSFDNMDLLEPYLASINIDAVYAILGYGEMH